jgi:hypothetical protein
MAVLTQVRLAHQRLRLAQRDFAVSADLLEVEEQLRQLSESAQKADAGNELERVRSLAQALVARMRYDQSLAELHNAFGRLQSSVGYDPIATRPDNTDVTSLATALAQTPEDWLATLARPEASE